MAAFDEQDYTKSFDIKIWKRLFPFLKTYSWDFVGMLVFNGVCALVDVVLPLFQRFAIANFIEPDTLSGLWPYALTYLGVILLQCLSVVAFARNSMRIEMMLGRDLRDKLFHHLQTLSFSFYNVTPVGYLLTRVMSDTNRIAGMIAWNFTDILWALFYVGGSFVSMLLLNWKLALVVILIVPVMAVLTGYFQNRILHWNRKVRKLNSRITGAFNEGITGAKTAKTLVMEDQSSDAFEELTGKMKDSGIRAARLNAVYIPLVLFFSTMAVAIVLLRGGHLVLSQVLELATLSAFTSYAVGIFEPIQMTAANIAEFISLQASIERVTDLLDKEPQVKDSPEIEAKYGDAFHPKKENWEPLRGEIEFRDVTFRYPDGGEDVLQHFSLHIPQGTTVAIVGETGAGKSTLVNLACRFFEPTAGQILIDGVDYRERSQLWLHSNIGYVLQNPHLFSGTVKENIRYGRLDATDEEVIAAAKTASAHSFIMRLENGYQTHIEGDGANLSQGQRQLLNIARAALSKAPILVLDEATSSVDTRTERNIEKGMDR
ncbi:MAG: ABC transporter ATP-binding protein, partial [Clostridia bacterium]|nr:ABC transporter ATP-binding protein [Clostridia bacterium]